MLRAEEPLRVVVLIAISMWGCAGGDDRDGDGVPDKRDCAPADPDISPLTPEACDGVDNDCDGDIDEDWDSDADGYPADDDACGDGAATRDCNDDNAAIFPGAQEICDDIDNDCSGTPDDQDEDSDGVGACDDCDDSDPFVYPGAAEACDGVDNDCSGGVDEPWDIDGDGLSSCDGDCNDDNPDIAEGLPELCDGLDNDCDDFVDEEPTCWACTLVGGYDYCETRVTWGTARSTCEGMGGSLASIEDAAERDLVGAEASTRLESYWIGLHDSDVEGTFEWLSGSPLTFDDFEAGEPDDPNGSSDCVAVYEVGWQWRDLPCTIAAMFVCEY